MKLLKKLSRTLLFPLLLLFRIDRFLFRKVKKKSCIINFHGVRKQEVNHINKRHIPVDEFEKIIKYLKKNFDVVSLKTLFEYYKSNKKLSRKTIALTFDDGYENNFSIALPILKKHNVPATYYIITNGLTDTSFISWPDKIDLLKRTTQKDLEVEKHLFPFPSYYNEDVKLDLIDFLKTKGDQINKLVDQLYQNLPEIDLTVQQNKELFSLINAAEFKKFADEPLIEFGSHTHSHPNLEYLNKESATIELRESKEILEKLIPEKIISLAFPDGSYSNETIEIALALGYQNLLAVDYKFNENNTNPNLLSRFTISNSTTYESNILRLAQQFDRFGLN